MCLVRNNILNSFCVWFIAAHFGNFVKQKGIAVGNKKAPDFLARASLTLIFIVACLVVYVSALFLHVKQLFGGEIVGRTLFLIGLLLRFQIWIVSLTEPLQQIGVV